MQFFTGRLARRVLVVVAVVLGGGLLRTVTPGPSPAAGVTDSTGDRLGELTYGISPGRYLDTRPATTVDGQYANVGLVAPGQVLVLPLRGRGSIPAEATGVMLNVTATGTTASGYLTVWPEGGNPGTSTLNFGAGATVANFAFVALGADGSIRLSVSGGSSHLLVDVVAFTSDLPTI